MKQKDSNPNTNTGSKTRQVVPQPHPKSDKLQDAPLGKPGRIPTGNVDAQYLRRKQGNP
jgi:hypothetical protein